MCGFIGFFGLQHAAPNKFDAQSIRSILHHRGPDASGVYDSSGAILVHNRLAILDLSSRADQPYVSEHTGCAIVFNGEIYNFRELKTRHCDIDWQTGSDTEVILRLYEKLGPSFVELLNGIFAFVIYDPLEQKVLAVRDRLGVKPLFVATQDGRIGFSSEIKGLLPLIGRPRLNRQAIRDYLDLGLLCHNDQTWVDGVQSVAPGTMLHIDLCRGQIKSHRYWQINDQSEDEANVERYDEKAAESRLSELLHEAAGLNLVSDVEVAVSLSSGLDSTLLLALLREVGPDQIRAYTFGYTMAEYDEVRRVKANESLNCGRLVPTYLQPKDVLDHLQHAIGIYESPLGGLGSLSAYHMMRTVSDHGIKVMLAGEGADEIFGGYRYYYPAFFSELEKDPHRLATEIEAYNRRHGDSLRWPSTQYDRLRESFQNSSVMAPDGTSLVSPYASVALQDMTRPFSSETILAGTGALNRVMRRDLVSNKLPKLLHFQDRASMAHGVETRVPYLDHRVVEFMYRLPAFMKIYAGQTKWLAQRLLKRRFDITLHQDVKHYVATPQREWLKGCLYEPVVQTLRGGALDGSGLVDTDRFFVDYAAYRENPRLGNSFFVWKMINMEYMLRLWDWTDL